MTSRLNSKEINDLLNSKEIDSTDSDSDSDSDSDNDSSKKVSLTDTIYDKCYNKFEKFVLLINPIKETCENFDDVYDLYNLKEKLGEGAFGIVYKAFNKITKKNVAIKFQKHDNTEYMFKIEISNLKRLLSRCNLFICIEGWGVYKKKMFISMEYIDGMILSDYISNLNESKHIDKIFDNIAKQLKYEIEIIHKNHLAHADIKPDNIIIKDNYVRILDFGIGCDDINIKCHKSGTYIYMPKYIESTLIGRQKTDWYALTLILLEILGYILEDDDDMEEFIQKLKTSRHNKTIILDIYKKSI
jgi:serine/threonine protein kinase